MADLTIPSGCLVTVLNIADLWQRVVGTAPDQTAGSPAEQSIIAGIDGAWNEGLDLLAVYGYSAADSVLALNGSLKIPLIRGSACWALRDVEELDSSREQIVQEYCTYWSNALERAQLTARDASGNPLTPNPSTAAAAAGLQGRETSRNGIDAPYHEFEFDANYGQFHGKASLTNRYAGSRYGNRRGGGI